MIKDVQFVERPPTPAEYQQLRGSTGWCLVDNETVGRALGTGLFAATALRKGTAVGCVRVVGDGALYFYIQDLIVLPEHRGQGIGTRLMDWVMTWLEEHARPNSFVGLMASADHAGFYLRYGFTPRPDNAPGMELVWARTGTDWER